MRCRKADIRVFEQHLGLGLQTLAKAFQPGTERQVSELFDDVFDHASRDPAGVYKQLYNM